MRNQGNDGYEQQNNVGKELEKGNEENKLVQSVPDCEKAKQQADQKPGQYSHQEPKSIKVDIKTIFIKQYKPEDNDDIETKLKEYQNFFFDARKPLKSAFSQIISGVGVHTDKVAVITHIKIDDHYSAIWNVTGENIDEENIKDSIGKSFTDHVINVKNAEITVNLYDD